MTEAESLVSDPVFQLNAFLWAVEDLPQESEIRPVLRNAGYYLSAIGRRVITPTDATVLGALLSLAENLDRSPVRPDLWLKHQSHRVDPLIELKARGFSEDSSNSRQAIKLIASAADLAPSLGEAEPHPGHVVYATVGADSDDMADTLDRLRSKLRSAGVPFAPTATIGFLIDEQGVSLFSPVPDDLPEPAAAALQAPAVIFPADAEDNDLRPLYFVPWMPGVEDSQAPDLAAEGLRELTARLLTQTIALVGQAQIPSAFTISADELLAEATFGVFSRWRDSDRRTFAQAGAKIIERTLRPTGFVRWEGGQLEIDLPTVDAQGTVIERLEDADPANPTRSLKDVVEEPPTLFDNLADKDED